MLTILTSYPFIVALIILYIFFSDDIKRVWRNHRNQAEALSTTDKIAKVKELSDDAKDIEKFIMTNAASLSAKSVDRLIARLDTLKSDRVIMDDNLQKRIADISSSSTEGEELPYADFGKAMIKGRSKKG